MQKRDTPHSVDQPASSALTSRETSSIRPHLFVSAKERREKRRGCHCSQQPTSPPFLRCIIQCFSHNRLRFEGLSLPQPCGEQSASIQEAPNPRFRLFFRLPGFSLSLISVRFIQPVHPWRDTQTPVDKSGNIFVLVGDRPQKLARTCVSINQSGAGGAQAPAGVRLQRSFAEALK